uniref:Aminopeptidase N-like N-terminal domain-containing protein n=1 Tax=Trichuris muris TaxID=70415 RepID=A0A5S6R0R7_TRIMR
MMDNNDRRSEDFKPSRRTWAPFVAAIGTALTITLMAVVVYYCLKSDQVLPVRSISRLPRTVFPSLYVLDIQAYFPLADDEVSEQFNFTFDGRVAIKLRCVNETSNITMHALHISINESSLSLVRSSDGLAIPFASPAFKSDPFSEMVTFHFLSNLLAEENYVLTIEYAGKLPDDLRGFYRTSYMKDGSKRWLLITQFQPTYARRALPCFDEPDFKAVFNVSLTHPASTIALSNMPAVSVQTLG